MTGFELVKLEEAIYRLGHQRFFDFSKSKLSSNQIISQLAKNQHLLIQAHLSIS